MVDEGAAKAVCADHKSLLPKGVRNVDGVFRKGDVIDVVDSTRKVILKAITSFSSSELLKIKGLSSKDIPEKIGGAHKVVFRPEDSVENVEL